MGILRCLIFVFAGYRGLKNDNVPEILNLSSADGRPFPAQFIKIGQL